MNSGRISLKLGDCLELLKGLESNSVDSIVTDPPYGIAFMGENWDKCVPVVAASNGRTFLKKK